jgi:hypothetical protein
MGRMLLATGDVAFADLIERTLFTGSSRGVTQRGRVLLRQRLAVRADAVPNHRSPSLGGTAD